MFLWSESSVGTNVQNLDLQKSDLCCNVNVAFNIIQCIYFASDSSVYFVHLYICFLDVFVVLQKFITFFLCHIQTFRLYMCMWQCFGSILGLEKRKTLWSCSINSSSISCCVFSSRHVCVWCRLRCLCGRPRAAAQLRGRTWWNAELRFTKEQETIYEIVCLNSWLKRIIQYEFISRWKYWCFVQRLFFQSRYLISSQF